MLYSFANTLARDQEFLKLNTEELAAPFALGLRTNSAGARSRHLMVSLDFIFIRAHDALMKFILSTHNVTLTKAIEDHILSRIDKLEHLDRFAIDARVTLEHDHTRAPERQFSCSIRLGVRGPDLFAEDSESDLYAAIDVVTKKIEQQIRKRHNKHKARKHTEASRSKRRRQDAEFSPQ
jgi:putative sigma-54 modulation protein